MELIVIYFHSSEIFIIQIGWRFVNQSLLLSSQIIFRLLNAFWIDFEALVHKIDVRALVPATQ
jgi:hypothetical protein